jgi:hypothetical protein
LGIALSADSNASTFALAFWFAVKLLINAEIDNVGTTIT